MLHIYTNWSNDVSQRLIQFEEGKFTVGPKAKRSCSIIFHAEFGRNLKVTNRALWRSCRPVLSFSYNAVVLFLVKPLVKISQNFPSWTGVVCVKSLLSEVCCRN